MCQTIATAKIKMSASVKPRHHFRMTLYLAECLYLTASISVSLLRLCVSPLLHARSLKRNVSFSLQPTTLCFKALADLLPHLLDLNLAKLDHETLAHHYKNNGPCL